MVFGGDGSRELVAGQIMLVLGQEQPAAAQLHPLALGPEGLQGRKLPVLGVRFLDAAEPGQA